MKQIFTIVLATALSLSAAFAQTTQTFETISGLSSLTNNCWQFTRVDFAAAAPANIGASNNLLAQTTDKRNNATIMTPYANLIAGGAISLDYKLNAPLNGAAQRTIMIRLLSIDSIYTDLGSVTLDRNSSTSAATFSVTSPVSAVMKVVFEFSGSGDGNSNINIDNLMLPGSFNYNSPYGCNTSGQATLPISLISFQGVLASGKVTLNWTVTENESGTFFTVEKSADGKTFQSVATITNTQKGGVESYSFQDAADAKTYYRISIRSKDGFTQYSNVVLVKTSENANGTLRLLQNPVQHTLKFSFQSDANMATNITVYNTLGVKVYQTTFNAFKGVNTVAKTLDATIKGGTYVLEISSATGRSVAKFLKD